MTRPEKRFLAFVRGTGIAWGIGIVIACGTPEPLDSDAAPPTPTALPTPTPVPTPTFTPLPAPTLTPTPTSTPTIAPTPTATPVPTATPTIGVFSPTPTSSTILFPTPTPTASVLTSQLPVIISAKKFALRVERAQCAFTESKFILDFSLENLSDATILELIAQIVIVDDDRAVLYENQLKLPTDTENISMLYSEQFASQTTQPLYCFMDFLASGHFLEDQSTFVGRIVVKGLRE